MSKHLSEIMPGNSGKILHISAGDGATRRLYEMGFCTGALVKVVKNDVGPVIVSLKGGKIALGRGLASKVELDVS